jgi:hypothetical protein
MAMYISVMQRPDVSLKLFKFFFKWRLYPSHPKDAHSWFLLDYSPRPYKRNTKINLKPSS